jgi:DNA-binding MarR family transcriptional regulator
MTSRFGLISASALGRGLSQNDWSVLVVICVHADRERKAFPSMATIAAEAHIGRQNVPRSLAKLEALDLIRRKRVPRRGGGCSSRCRSGQMPAE